MPKAPRTLLRDVCWSFAEAVVPTAPELTSAARDYAEEVGGPDPTRQLLAELPFSDVRLRYEHWIRSTTGDWEAIQAEVRVVASSGQFLKGADLLWELHVACESTVGQGDRHFFEGLELEGAEFGTSPPVYVVLLGS